MSLKLRVTRNKMIVMIVTKVLIMTIVMIVTKVLIMTIVICH